jgi:hypothetical protein
MMNASESFDMDKGLNDVFSSLEGKSESVMKLLSMKSINIDLDIGMKRSVRANF